MLTAAVVGLYKSAGVELVRRQIEDELRISPTLYELSAEGIVVFPNDDADCEVLYDLREGPWIAPQTMRGMARRRLPTVERQQIVFGDSPVAWDRWVETWSNNAASQGNPLDRPEFSTILP